MRSGSRRLLAATLLGMALMGVAATGPAGAQSSVTWSRTAALDSCRPVSPSCAGRSAHTVTALRSGRVLVAGGRVASGDAITTSATAELFDPAAGTWSPTGSMHEPRRDHTATLLSDGRVLVAGGTGQSGVYLATAEVYDPVSGSWTATGPLAFSRFGHTATLIGGPAAGCQPSCGSVLVAGGNGNNPTTELWDPSSGSWHPVGVLAENRRGAVAVQLLTGRVLMVGGDNFGRPFGQRRSAELFDPLARRWVSTGSIPGPTSTPSARGGTAPQFLPVESAAALLRDGRVLVAGGHLSVCGTGPTCSLSALYDPGAGTWALTGRMLEGRYSFSALTLADGTVLAVGGAFASAERYDPARGTWSAAGTLGSRRVGDAAVLLPGGPPALCGGRCGRVLVVGGGIGDSPADDASVELSSVVGSSFVAVPQGTAAAGSASSGAGSTARNVALLAGAGVLVLGIAALMVRRRRSSSW